MLVVDESNQPSQNGKKTTAFLIALAVHAAIIIIAGLIIVMPSLKNDPEIIAAVVTPPAETEIKIEKKHVTKQAENVSSSAAASPIAKMLRAQTTAQIAAPEVVEVTDSPIGLGDGLFGGGFGSGMGGGGMGQGATLFGTPGTAGLKGNLYDLKRYGNGTPRKFPPFLAQLTHQNIVEHYLTYMPLIRELKRRSFTPTAFNEFKHVGKPLTFSTLVIPFQDAQAAPKAFGAENEMEPSAWMAAYNGKLRVDKPTKYRFVGRFDDLLVIYINGRVVLDGSWNVGDHASDWRVKETMPKTALFGNTIFIGDWITLRTGDRIDILIGEIPGGDVGGAIFIQEQGVEYNGHYAPFVIGNLTKFDRERLEKIPNLDMTKIPKFSYY